MNEALYNEFMANPNADLGLLPTDQAAELLGVVAAKAKSDPRVMQEFHRKQVVAINKSGVVDNNSRGQMMRRLDMLPKDIRQGLLNQKLQVITVPIFSCVFISNTTQDFDLIPTDGPLKDFVRNISDAKLEKDRHFMLVGLRLTSGVTAGDGSIPTDVDFDVAEKQILDGQIQLSVNDGQEVLPERTPASIFDTTDRTDVPRGFYPLDNPKMVEPEKTIKVKMKLPAVATVKTWVRLELIGAMIWKA